MGNPQQLPLVATSGSLMLGGSTTFLLNLAAAMRRRGWQLPVVSLTDAIDQPSDFAAAGVEPLSISTRGHIYEDRLAWGYRQVARFQPRAVLACLSSESYEILRLVPPGVVRLGMIQSDDPGPYGLPVHFAPWLDGMVGVSAEICAKLRSLPECGRLHVEHIPYGIDFPSAVKRVIAPAHKPLRVVYLGRLLEVQKRISRLVRLIQLLEARHSNVQFTVVGNGPDEATFRAAVAGCQSVQIRDAVPYAQVPALLREQDVYILLSDFEGLPLSLLEAMAEGVVPVLSDLPSGIREVVTSETGCRVPIGDVEAAARVLEQLATDRGRLQKLASAAACLAREHYSADRMLERYLSTIEQLDRTAQPVQWPAEVQVPAPLLVKRPWLYAGWRRKFRRLLKSAFRGQSLL